MKKLLRIPLLLVAMLLSSIPISAHDFEVDGIFYNINGSFTVEVTYSGGNYSAVAGEYTGNVTIPETVTYLGTTYSVTAIGYNAFCECRDLTSVAIPNSVTSIGDFAFKRCAGLTSVTIGNSVTEIGDNAFDGCRGLTSITIPDSVITIGEYAFYGCTGLTSVTIGNSVTEIGDFAFEGCTSLRSVTIPSSVTSIGGHAFWGTPWFHNKPDGLVYINKVLYAYKGVMKKNTSIEIADGTVSISGYAFSNDSEHTDSLASVIIPNSVTSIGREAFYGCTNLTSVTIPNSVTWIGDRAFLGTPWIKNQPDALVYAGSVLHYDKGYCSQDIVIKDGTVSISPYVFCNTNLASVTIPNSVTSIGEKAFGFRMAEINISDLSAWCKIDMKNISLTGDKLKLNGMEITDLVIPDDVTEIKNFAFYGCRGLTSVTIPNSVTSIGEYAFYECTGLTSVTIGNSVTEIGDLAFYECTGLTSVTIPNSVTSIGEYAFYECTGLTSVTIPNSVTSIGEYAFSSCSGLTSVTIPNSVTWIDDHAFSICIGLTSVTIPNSVTSIGYRAFSSCYGLTSVTIPNSVTWIGDRAFTFCTGLGSVISLNPVPPICKLDPFDYVSTSCVLYVPKGSVNDYSNANGWSKFTNIIELDENGEIPEVEVAVGNGEVTISFPKEENMTECKLSVCATIFGSAVVKESIWVDNSSRSSSSQISMSVEGLDVGDYIYRVSVKYNSGEVVEKYAGKFSIDTSGIEDVDASQTTEVARYDLHGRLLSAPTQGINIIKMSDGSTRKEFVK